MLINVKQGHSVHVPFHRAYMRRHIRLWNWTVQWMVTNSQWTNVD